MIESPGLSVYDTVEGVLSGEPGALSDSIAESCHRVGLSATSSSGVTGGVGANQDAEGMLRFSGMTLALGEEYRVDRCYRKSLVEGDVIDVVVLGGWGM